MAIDVTVEERVDGDGKVIGHANRNQVSLSLPSLLSPSPLSPPPLSLSVSLSLYRRVGNK